MGRASGALRSFLLAVDGLPSRALTAADDAFWRLDVPAPATVVAGVLTPPGRGGSRSWRWANAGHPPPAVLRADGRVELLAGDGADLLLGVDTGRPRREYVHALGSGDTVLLYSDGLVERRDDDLDGGLARLRAALAELAGRPLQETCDALLERLVRRTHTDDVALVAVRLHPHDRPRPADAGPSRP